MRTIAVTLERVVLNEANAIEALLEEGFDLVHIRKPLATRDEVADLLREISSTYYSRIVLHDYLSLALDFGLGGVHLNRRSPHPPCGYLGAVSTSCHSLSEAEDVLGDVEYLFLSPIYNSVSKMGYMSGFTREELRDGSERGVICEKVVALGGVTPQNIKEIKDLGFGGVALLGYLWQDLNVFGIRYRAQKVLSAIRTTKVINE